MVLNTLCDENTVISLFPGYEYGGRYPGSDYMRSAGDYYGMGGFEGGRAATGAGYATAGYGAYRYPGYVMCMIVIKIKPSETKFAVFLRF